ncbi:hypothetical protein EJ05DRAFT_186119 [Pseudovirgaria hyperparasitica]|uniref:Zinc finger PHD-type domain-containing protein n=1 Tax=Pseudovirgaria hyperparasitica TaxID=470096 RepID=A0A6A6WG99_9PEZI|nr:uncharacterized protein EJ05DRAFT_186119 [Pseudovirgaria hyperparasitica]KAF2761828.1 hypothetical protein EJ05DRAFT_186119 [Pseudovirgaria hyperparasitica]
MVTRKRAAAEMETDEVVTETSKEEPALLDRIRNMWQFASLFQYIFIFGKAVKIDEDLGIEDLEAELLKPVHSPKLSEIGLALLKYVSSHKGLTIEIFDEYTRRQYIAKAPSRNPFGTEEEPKKFAEFDVFTKIRVLHQLSTWTLGNADRIREKIDEKNHTEWRIEPFGWDAEQLTYFVLDDNRLYRQTPAPLPLPPKAKSKAKTKKRKSLRASKRRRVVETEDEETSDTELVDDNTTEEQEKPTEPDDDGFGGMKWECLAVTREDYSRFLDSMRRTRDPDQKDLVKRIDDNVLPILDKQVEEMEVKRQKQLRELEVMQKLAQAKRSSRLAGKQEARKEQEAAEEAERKKQADLAMAHKEQERQSRMEQDRQSRMMTREQRLKDREVKRILHEEELAKLEEEKKKVEANEARGSERYLKAEMQRRKEELEKLTQEEDWVFDCSKCGVYGENLDDGTHSIACETCNVWQHSACHNIPQSQAESEDFKFECGDCKKKSASAARRAKEPPLKIRLNTNPSSHTNGTSTAPGVFKAVEIPVPGTNQQAHQHRDHVGSVMNGPSLSPQGQRAGPPGAYAPPAEPTGGFMFPPAKSISPPVHSQSTQVPSQGQTTAHAPAYARLNRSRNYWYDGRYESNNAQMSPPPPNMPSHPQQNSQNQQSQNQQSRHQSQGPVPYASQHQYSPQYSPQYNQTYQPPPPVPYPTVPPKPKAPSSSPQPNVYLQLEYPNHSNRRSSLPGSNNSSTSRVLHHDPFRNDFARVTKNSTSASPTTPNGAAVTPPAAPDSTARPSSQNGPPSPTKSAIATPRPHSQTNSHSPAVPLMTPLQQSSQPQPTASPHPMLPDPATGISPEKHDVARPLSSQGTELLPGPTLSPTASQSILTPPVKNPTPVRPVAAPEDMTSLNGTDVGQSSFDTNGVV